MIRTILVRASGWLTEHEVSTRHGRISFMQMRKWVTTAKGLVEDSARSIQHRLAGAGRDPLPIWRRTQINAAVVVTSSHTCSHKAMEF